MKKEVQCVKWRLQTSKRDKIKILNESLIGLTCDLPLFMAK